MKMKTFHKIVDANGDTVTRGGFRHSYLSRRTATKYLAEMLVYGTTEQVKVAESYAIVAYDEVDYG